MEVLDHKIWHDFGRLLCSFDFIGWEIDRTVAEKLLTMELDGKYIIFALAIHPTDYLRF